MVKGFPLRSPLQKAETSTFVKSLVPIHTSLLNGGGGPKEIGPMALPRPKKGFRFHLWGFFGVPPLFFFLLAKRQGYAHNRHPPPPLPMVKNELGTGFLGRARGPEHVISFLTILFPRGSLKIRYARGPLIERRWTPGGRNPPPPKCLSKNPRGMLWGGGPGRRFRDGQGWFQIIQKKKVQRGLDFGKKAKPIQRAKIFTKREGNTWRPRISPRQPFGAKGKPPHQPRSPRISPIHFKNQRGESIIFTPKIWFGTAPLGHLKGHHSFSIGHLEGLQFWMPYTDFPSITNRPQQPMPANAFPPAPPRPFQRKKKKISWPF